jgi:hypothetical protein
LKYRLPYKFILFILLPLLAGCGNLGKKKRLDERITLKKGDKIPYGTFVAYEDLQYLFPNAEITTNKESPSSISSFLSDYSYSTQKKPPKALYVIITPEFYPDQQEYDALLRFVGAGNHVFVSSFSWSKNFTDSLNLRIFQPETFVQFEDSLEVSIKHPVTYDSMDFAYPGKSDDTYFVQYDSNYSSVVGHERRHPNLIRQAYQGGGSITIQSDPLAFSNFFLLHKKNHTYYDETFSYFPRDIDAVVWDQYFRYRKNGGGFNSLQVILANKGFRTAFWLMLLLFALIYLFESKRKQRIIPLIKPLKNTSLDFVKTVGRLYHQYRDNKNLGQKMTAHLMEYIRQKYNLPTTTLDDQFISSLAFKSGYPTDKLHSMIYKAKMINDFASVNDEDLMDFHRQTEAFYKYQ